MKLLFVAFACLAIANTTALPRMGFGSLIGQPHASTYSNINNDLRDIIDLVPRSKIEDIVANAAENSAEIQSDLEYVTSADVQRMGQAIENSPEFLKVREKMEGVGVDMIYFMNYVHDILEWPHVTKSSVRAATTGDLRDLLMNKIKPEIPTTRIKLLVARKYIFSSAFRKFANLLLSTNFSNDVKAIFASEPATTLMKDAVAHDVDLQAIFDFIKSLASILYETLDKPGMLPEEITLDF